MIGAGEDGLKDFNEPRLVAILDEKGNDGQNLLAVMELYSNWSKNLEDPNDMFKRDGLN